MPPAAGLRLLDEYRAALGAADLRATASSLGVELARLGLRIALADTGTPERVLGWSERLRAQRTPARAGHAASPHRRCATPRPRCGRPRVEVRAR